MVGGGGGRKFSFLKEAALEMSLWDLGWWNHVSLPNFYLPCEFSSSSAYANICIQSHKTKATVSSPSCPQPAMMVASFFFFKLIFFDVHPFLNSIGSVTILLLLYVLVFWLWNKWDLRSPTRDQTYIPCIGRWSLNHWTSRDVLQASL